MKSMRIKPSLCCIFDQSCEESVRKLDARRIDPMTGKLYNTEVEPPKDGSVSMRLKLRPEDSGEIVKKRFEKWNSNIQTLEDNYRNCLLSVKTDTMTIDKVFEQIKEAIENPII